MNLIWLQEEGSIGQCLLTPERAAMFKKIIGDLIDNKASLLTIMNTLEKREDMTLNDWVAIAYSLGYCDDTGEI